MKITKTQERGMRDRICNSQDELHDWIKYFLKIDFPDYTVDDRSTSNPMAMIWWIYDQCIHQENKKMIEALFIANRSGYKTLGMSVAELLVLHHGKRDVCHIGAIQAQAKRCYNYFTKYFRGEGFRDLLTKDPVMEKTILEAGTTLEILPCTLASVNGPHVPFVGVDELDTTKDYAAVKDIDGIPSRTHDGKPPVKVNISTRKTAYGLVAKKADEAHKTGLQVFSWNIIDLTKQCPDERSLTKRIDIYVNPDTLESISRGDFEELTSGEQNKFEKYDGYEGCLKNCKMFAACLGNLKKQKSTSALLHDIEFTEDSVMTKDADWVNAQVLCRKPSVEGLIYPRFKYEDHIKSYAEMWEIFTGEKPEKKNITLEELSEKFNEHGIYPVLGQDFGDTLGVILMIFIDGKENVYVVFEKTFTATDDAEVAEWAKNNLLQFQPDMVYPDPANPSGVRLMTKAGFTCHDKVDKDVWGGIGTVRRFLRKPGTNKPKMYFHYSCANLIDEVPKYHKKKVKATDMIIDEPEKVDDHSCDSLRYPLHTIFGQNQANLGFEGPRKKAGEDLPFVPNKSTRAPDPTEVAGILGISQFNDNRQDYIKDEKTGKMRKRLPGETDEDDSGFSF